MLAQRKTAYILACIITFIVVVGLRLIYLDRLPGEIYGDIVIVLDTTAAVLRGDWPTGFVLSAGPLYQYTIAPIIWITGLNYLGIKLASVVISLAVLGIIFVLGRELLNGELALLALFIAGVSSWLLIFSRLGNSQILVPLLTGAALYFALRTNRPDSTYVDSIACGLIAALGFYTYPQNFILPGVILLTLVWMGWLGAGIQWDQLGVFVLMVVLWSIPFALIVLHDQDNFFTGYIGEKSLLNAEDLAGIILLNIWHGLQALHLRGDAVFRSNPASLPHLDLLTGILFLIGVVFWLQPGRRHLAPALFVPLVLLQLPSLLVRYPQQVPSASRTLGIMPMVALIAASGLWWLMHSLPFARWLNSLLMVTILAAILGLNGYRYFVLYPQGLPNQNIAFQRIIAEHIDSLPPTTHTYVVGCCWGDWSQPHPRGIYYAVENRERLHLIEPEKLTCATLHGAEQAAMLLWGPQDTRTSLMLRLCRVSHVPPVLHTSENDDSVFWFARLHHTEAVQ